MALPSSSDSRELCRADQETLLDIAQASIASGLRTGSTPAIDLANVSADLRRIQSSFVTLGIREHLRGCIGSIGAARPLALDVNQNAFAAAFQDIRFPILRDDEFSQINICISVLSPQTPIASHSLREAMEGIRPGIDGVVMRKGGHVATFLPQVWETFQDPIKFLRHLRLKAGLDPQSWPPDIHLSTYTIQQGSRDVGHPVDAVP